MYNTQILTINTCFFNNLSLITSIAELHATLKSNFQVLHRLATVLLRQILESRLQHTKPLAGDILPVVYYFG